MKTSRSRAQAAPPRGHILRSKLMQIVSRHEQLKVVYHQLHSQIKAGLIEAEDVFASLAVPLTALVGLKTNEMAREGRFSAILTFDDLSRTQAPLLLGENFTSKATTANNEMINRQKLHLAKLINILKTIEIQMNSRRRKLFQDLADNQDSLKKFFIKAFAYFSTVHQSGRSDDLSIVMLKILWASYKLIGDAIGSVELEIDDMIHELAQQICHPMVEYVNDVKQDMRTGTCSRLLGIIKEMDEELKITRFGLEEARQRAKVAEESMAMAMSKLKASEETVVKLNTSLALLTDYSTEPAQDLATDKVPSVKEDHGKDENLLWGILKKKRNIQVETNEVLEFATGNKGLNKTSAPASYISHRIATRSQSRTLALQSPSFLKSKMISTSSRKKSPLASNQSHEVSRFGNLLFPFTRVVRMI